MGHDQILLAARQAKDDVEKLFNQTEKQLQRTTSETSFSSAELSWALYTKGDRYSKFLSYSALISIKAAQKLSRTYSGHCNNVNHPQRGAIYEPLRRLLAPDYEDKVSTPRSAKSGTPLPPATEVASLFTPAPRGHATCSMILAQWASFIYDDLAHVASNRLVKEGFFTTSRHLPLPCCNPAVDHPECFPIRGRDGKCLLSLRILSASHGGLPQSDDDEECKKISANAEQCFLAGSQRINFLPSNAVMYTMWMRQHNFVAGKLKEVNPTWSDEKLFQEARRIVIAQIQHITYNEFVPVIVGKENLRRNSLDLQVNGYDSRYDMVFNDPSFIYQRNRFDAVVRFLTRSPIMKPGLHITPELRNAFGKGPFEQGIDMAAFIVQMGRDHGIPGYLQWRRHCGLESVQSFASMSTKFLPSINASMLEQLYESPEDVDLIVGGLAEAPLPGALLGPTLSCLFAEQMQKARLKVQNTQEYSGAH
ncbi:animal hem peroxidase [Ancylostoma ceylanicum]|uniref:Animal hem peroxidase n=1 Tax=Ancylostoma ceylanicum TaxID=53326 RepID=A0A0D6LJR6_9BILA|nr:animal hem peroxidase [Ancylostoma ceylanicum]